MESIPKTAKGVIVSKDHKVSYEEYKIPALKDSDVLIKIHSAVINPSDVFFTKGLYPIDKALPTPGGLEGSGTVIAAGNDAKAQALLNKKVCFLAQEKYSPGSWAEYTVVSTSFCLPMPGDLSYEEGAACFINPLTAQGFIYESQKNGYKCIVHSAAASQLGRMLLAGCKLENITVINVVRRQEQVDILKQLGAEIIVNTGQENWQDDFKAKCDQYKPQAYFDPIASKMASEIITLLPNKSTIYNYGALAGMNIDMSVPDLIFHGKVLKGWWINTALEDPETASHLFKKTFENLASRAFQTKIAAKFDHSNFEKALKAATESKATNGKILFQNHNF